MEEIVSSRSDLNCSESTVCVDLDKVDVGQKSNDDYYEVISADGSIGGDDEDDFHENDNTTDISGNDSALRNKQCSIVDLPFVPKFEFIDESNLDRRNSPLNVASSSGALRVNKFRPGHMQMQSRLSNFSIPPQINLGQPSPLNLSVPPPPLPNLTIPPPSLFTENFHNKQFSGADLETEQISPSHLPSSLSATNYSGIPTNTNIQNTGGTVALDDSSSSISNSLAPQSGSQQTSRKIKKAVSDWVDENGDPLPGAFDGDVVHSPNEDVSVDDDSNTKVEYVFSVREKKCEPSKDPHVSAFSLMNSNVSQNAAGNLGFSLGNKLALTVPNDTASYDAEEEKKLYEASKSGAEYKAAIQSSSASTDPGPTQKIIAENENAKNERFNRFKRNRFTDRKDDEPGVDCKEEPPKTQAEQALESQAVTEILKEVQRGAIRAKEQGALGWQKCPVPVTNKTFLRNTLVSTLREPYRPPNKRGRFHVGLQRGNNSQRQDYDDDSSSRSSRSSRSRSSSRSRRSYSYSSSGSSRSGDGRRDSSHKGKHFQRGSWPGGQDEYYDWAAYAAQYGYQWYGPEAYGMYYGEGWPMEAYAAMYYGDPQAWADYEAYYGPQNFNGRGRGRVMRGRGRGGRFRGRGSFPDNFRGYDRDLRSRSRDFSRSLSRDRSERSRSYSPGPSRRVRSPDSRNRSEVRSPSRSRRLTRSSERSKEGGPGGNRSVSESTDKKKKKKKKKKHRKSKKSKHKSKHREEKSEKETGEVNEKNEGKERRGEEDESCLKMKKERKKKHRMEKDGDTKGKHSRHKNTEKRTGDTKSRGEGTNEDGLEAVGKEESNVQKSQSDSHGGPEGLGEKTEHVVDRGEEQVRKGKRKENKKNRKECTDDQLNRSREPEEGKKAESDKDNEIQRGKLKEDRTSDKRTSRRSRTIKDIDPELAKGSQSSHSKNKVDNKNDKEYDKQKKVTDKEDSSNFRRGKDFRSLNRLCNKSDNLKDPGRREKGTTSGSWDSEENKEDKKSITERCGKRTNTEGTLKDMDNSRGREDINEEKCDGKHMKEDFSSCKMKERGSRGEGDNVQEKKSHDPTTKKLWRESGKDQKSTRKEERSQTGRDERGEKRRNADETGKKMGKNISRDASSNEKERDQKGSEEDIIRSDSGKKLSDKNKRSQENIKQNRLSDASTINDRLSRRILDSREDVAVSAENRDTRKLEEEMKAMPKNSEMPEEQVFSGSTTISDGKTEKGEIMENCKSKQSEMDQAEKDVDNKSSSSLSKVLNNESRVSNVSLEGGQGNVSEASTINKNKKKIVKRKSDVQVKKKKIKLSEGGEADLSRQPTDQSAEVGDPGTTVKRKKKIFKLKGEETPQGKKRKMQEDTETVDVKTDGL